MQRGNPTRGRLRTGAKGRFVNKTRPLLTLLPFVMLVLASLNCASIPPQDCMKMRFTVRGYVVDSGSPIADASVKVHSPAEYDQRAFDLITNSDVNGYFETQQTASFACIKFEVEIAAAGYKPVVLAYHPPGEEWPDELPEELSIVLENSD